LLLDDGRLGGARQALADAGVALHSVFTITELLDHWEATRRIDAKDLAAVRRFIEPGHR
jgi:orotate phosphoribosyltransferase